MCSILLGNHYEVFLENNHLYRLFISAMSRNVQIIHDNWIEECDVEIDEKNYDNLMIVIERYRLIVCIKRKLSIFCKESAMPDEQFVRNSLIKMSVAIAEKMKNKGKDNIANQYLQLAKVFAII